MKKSLFFILALVAFCFSVTYFSMVADNVKNEVWQGVVLEADSTKVSSEIPIRTFKKITAFTSGIDSAIVIVKIKDIGQPITIQSQAISSYLNTGGSLFTYCTLSTNGMRDLSTYLGDFMTFQTNKKDSLVKVVIRATTY